MKKYLLILSILLLGLIACNDKKEVASPKNEAIQEVSISEEERQYKAFQEVKMNEFSAKRITEVSVIPFAKGIDIIFLTDKKDWEEKKFMEIAKKTVEDFKAEFALDKEINIGIALDYQADPSQNTETLFSKEIK